MLYIEGKSHKKKKKKKIASFHQLKDVHKRESCVLIFHLDLITQTQSEQHLTSWAFLPAFKETSRVARLYAVEQGYPVPG